MVKKYNKKPNLEIDLSGPDGNVFVVLGRASALLRGQPKKKKEMIDRVTKSGSYMEALKIINEYVRIRQITGVMSEPLFK